MRTVTSSAVARLSNIAIITVNYICIIQARAFLFRVFPVRLSLDKRTLALAKRVAADGIFTDLIDSRLGIKMRNNRFRRVLYWLAVLSLYGCTSTYLIRGEGGESCSTVREKVQSDPQYRSFYNAWLLGYITRYNYDHETKLGRGYKNKALVDTALQYCREHPLDDFDQAALHVTEQLRQKQ